jgi:putative aldouronate transport system substrate-binding protein
LLPTLKAEFVDLAAWLAGDGIKKWPNLAAIAPFGWDAVNIGGGIWGIPFTQNSQFGTDCLVRQDIFDQHGIPSGAAGTGITQPKDGQEFLDLCAELTDSKTSKWAISDVLTSGVRFVSQMVGVPNAWKLEDGEFISDYESDEYKDMMDTVHQLWSKGYIYPDASATLVDGQNLLMSGKAAMVLQSDKNWGQLMSRSDDPKFEPGGVVLPAWSEGGQSAHYLSSGLADYTAFKKASQARITELLDVCNWFAAPFGSQERLFISYGIPERDYTLKGTDPVATPAGIQECFNYRLDYLATLPMGTLISGYPDLAKRLHSYIEVLMKKNLPLLSAGLYAPTVLTTGATINKAITSLRNDIILGRKPVSAWDGGVKTWRSGGGDQIKKEYTAAYNEKGASRGSS